MKLLDVGRKHDLELISIDKVAETLQEFEISGCLLYAFVAGLTEVGVISDLEKLRALCRVLNESLQDKHFFNKKTKGLHATFDSTEIYELFQSCCKSIDIEFDFYRIKPSEDMEKVVESVFAQGGFILQSYNIMQQKEVPDFEIKFYDFVEGHVIGFSKNSAIDLNKPKIDPSIYPLLRTDLTINELDTSMMHPYYPQNSYYLEKPSNTRIPMNQPLVILPRT